MNTFEVIISILGTLFVLFVGAGIGKLDQYHQTIELLVDLAEDLAKRTPSTVDDEMIAKIKEALNANQDLSENG